MVFNSDSRSENLLHNYEYRRDEVSTGHLPKKRAWKYSACLLFFGVVEDRLVAQMPEIRFVDIEKNITKQEGDE